MFTIIYMTLHKKRVTYILFTLYTKIIFSSKTAKAVAIRQKDKSFYNYDKRSTRRTLLFFIFVLRHWNKSIIKFFITFNPVFEILFNLNLFL